jgi:hypothetical protein
MRHTADQWHGLAAQGLTAAEAAQRLGVSTKGAEAARRNHGVEFKRGRIGRPSVGVSVDGAEILAIMGSREWTASDIGARFGIITQTAIRRLQRLQRLGQVEISGGYGRQQFWKKLP